MKHEERDLERLWACAPQEARQRTTDLARRALRAPISVLTSFSGTYQLIRSRSESGPSTDALKLSGLLCRDVVATDRPLILSRLAVEAPYRDIMRDIPVEAYIGVPLRLSCGQVIGVLCVLDTEPHEWTGDDLELITELAAVLAGQIELRLEITSREQAEAALETSESTLQSLADRIPGFVFQRRKLAPDRWSYTVFGCNKLRMEGVRQIVDRGSAAKMNLIHDDDRDRVLAEVGRSNQDETDLDLTFRMKSASGRPRWIRSRAMVRRERDGGLVWDGVCFEIDDLVTAREDAEAARAAKDTLLVNVNHELRAPLQAIIGFTDFLKLETRPELVAAHAMNIQSAAQALLALVNQLLREAGSSNAMSPAVTSIDIRAFAEICLSMVGPAAVEKHLTLRLDVADDVATSVSLDSQSLRQALVNLLNNAVKFTSQGSVTLRVASTPTGLRFCVTDTGIGVPDEKLDLLFKRFSRLAPEDRQVEGSGLGLSITKALVESMDGEIGVTSSSGAGTTFWFEIPLPPQPAADAAVSTPPPVVDSTSLPVPMRILLADDLDLNRKLIADMLGIDGHLVDCVADGQAALTAASQQTYDLILMDMMMPVLDGPSAARAIRALPAPACNVPILALTANSFQEQLDTCLSAGMDATLVKPMSIEALSAAVATWARCDRIKAA